MITLFGHPNSPNSRKVHTALEELGIPYNVDVVDLSKRVQKSPAYLAMNPNGRVPTLKDGDLIMWESNAIILYLAERYGRGVLLPDDVAERAHCYQWLSWQGTDLGPAFAKPFSLKFMARFGQALDIGAHNAAVAGTHTTLAILDQGLSRTQYVAGSSYSVADIAIMESLGIAAFSGVSLEPYGHVSSYFERLSLRPAVHKTRPSF